ncbi:MAG: hypothetical protein HC843_00780 [Sphingomonadales bacterium]|nr:hypothetical protein [Sphingomonadales bacterium]
MHHAIYRRKMNFWQFRMASGKLARFLLFCLQAREGRDPLRRIIADEPIFSTIESVSAKKRSFDAFPDGIDNHLFCSCNGTAERYVT